MGATAAAVVTGTLTAPLAIKAAGIKAALGERPDPLCEGVQALVKEIRRDLPPATIMGAVWVYQQAADRLEALPGIEAVANEYWTSEHQEWASRHGMAHVLREARS